RHSLPASFDGVDTKLAGQVDSLSLGAACEEPAEGRWRREDLRSNAQGAAGEGLDSDANCETAKAEHRAEVLVRRGHACWREFRYHAALQDFEEAAALEAPGGPAALSLLCLRFCLGVDLGCRDLVGHDTAKALAEGLTQLWRQCWERHARQLRILRPRKSLTGPSEELRYEGGMEIMDGTCAVGAGEATAEVGYRLHVNRRSKAKETALIIYYHGNGEICEEYTNWSNVYEVFPCSMLVFDYRGYGWSSGKPSMANLLSDAEQCMEQLPLLLKKHGLRWPWPGPLLLMGRSLGGMVASHLISTQPEARFDGLLLDSAFATCGHERLQQLKQWLGASSEADMMFQELSNALRRSLPAGEPGQEQLLIYGSQDFLRGFRGPLLVLHGRHDLVVTPDNAKKHLDAAVNCCERELIELDADHNSMAGVTEFWKSQIAFAKRQVRRKQDAE
ncbi:unnamed protein product, partial [Effrenium voratum]